MDQFTFSGATDFDYHFYAFESSNSFDEVIIGVADNSGWNLDNLRYESLSPPIPAYACAGFEPPLDNGPVTVTRNKVLPLKAQLFDDNGYPIDNVSILKRPVLQVTFVPEFSDIPIDITDDALPWWKGSWGNIFRFRGDRWKFNLKTKHYTAPGKYNIGIVSGDTSEYVINPACQVQFQRD